MKKLILFAVVMIFVFSPAMTFAVNNVNVNSEILSVPVTENKLLEVEISNMKEHLDKIRDTDKADMSAKDMKELKKEMKANKKASGGIYIGAGTLLLVVLLIVLLV
ncbi:MAG: hypothetical protein ACOH2V_04690 [Candidatus Saccharimonadaceae bacterium]